MLNRVVLIGRLTRDPELRYTQSGIAVANFTLAVDRNFKNANGERDVDFIDCQVWRQMAENCAEYLSKGKLAAVDGSLRIRTYEAQDGSKRKAVEVVADNVRFLSPKGDSANKADAPQDDRPWPQDAPPSDDDLPF